MPALMNIEPLLILWLMGATGDSGVDGRLEPPLETIVITHRSRDRTAPDTELRLSREELIQRGLTSVPEALAQLPEIAMHENRRGGLVVGVRGGRQRQLLVIVDGVPVNEPWRGNFDLGTLPITEVEEIRLRTSPATPLDGLGGSAGIVEIVTRPTDGALEATAQTLVTTDPAARVSVTGRGELGARLSTRMSAGGFTDRNALDLAGPGDGALLEDRDEGFASARLSFDRTVLRLFADGFVSRRSYWIPPDDDAAVAPSVFERVDREDSVRSVLGADLRLGSWSLSGRAYGQRLEQELSRYRDVGRESLGNREQVRAQRAGAIVEGGFVRGGWRLDGRAELQTERAVLESSVAVDPVGGRTTIGQLSTGASWIGEAIEILGSAGVATPVGTDAEPWLEGQLEARSEPLTGLELGAVLARKGRLPSLRERFDRRGDPNAPPEISDSGELKATVATGSVRVTGTGFTRRIESFIALGAGASPDVNGADLTLRGLEALVDWRVNAWASLGAGHTWLDADPNDGEDREPLPFVPKHRFDLWARLQGDALGLWTRTRYTSERLDQGRALEPYLLAEVSAWWQLDERLRFSLRIDNLANARYHVRSNLLGDGTRVTFSVEGRIGG